MKKFLVILPAIALMAILIGSPTAFAQSASGGSYHGQQMNAASHAATASASPAGVIGPCTSCNGQDPYHYTNPFTGETCAADEAKSLETISVVGGTVTLWWSDSCETNWTVTTQNGTSYIADANTVLANGLSERNIASGNSIYSPMAYAPTVKAKACGSINNWTGGCTGWY